MLATFPNLGLTWDDLDWLRAQTTLPILVKGVLTADDAELALQHGIDGIIVSNHGGRQVDGAVAALDALVEVRDALPDAVVLMDGGIRSAADVLKAMALGADAVLLGRPYAYALAVGGQRGVEELIQNLMAEIDLTLALAGGHSIRELDRSWLTSGVVLGEPGASRSRRSRVEPPGAGRGARPHRGDRRLPHRPARDRGGRLGPRATRSCSGTRARARSRRSATVSTGSPTATGSCSAGRPPAATCATCGAASRAMQAAAGCAGPAAPRDGAVLTPVLRTGTFATHTVVPAVAAVKVPRELPVEQACLIGCAVATGVMSVLETAKVWEGARVAVIGCGAVGLSVIQGARIAGASEIRAIDLDERKLEQARRFGATHAEPGPVDFVFDVVGAPLDVRAGRSRCSARGGTFVLIGLSPAGEKAEIDCRGSSEARADPRLARRRPPAAGGLSAARAAGRSTARSTSPGWSRARRRSTAGTTLDAMRGGDVIRTVLMP